MTVTTHSKRAGGTRPSRRPAPERAHDDQVASVQLTEACSPAVAGTAIEAQAVHCGLPPVRAAQLRVLVERLITEGRSREAVPGDTDVEVRLHHGPGHLRVEVRDRRLPLTAAETRRSQARRLAALGFADRIRIGRDGELGNRAEVEVQLDTDDSVADFVEPHDIGGPDTPRPPRVSEAEASALEVREMSPSDAAGLARCVYRCYGYTYLNPMLYRPRQIAAALRTGQMTSVVAVTPDGEVVGHMALTFDHSGDPVPEAGKLVVDPRYRGYHLSDRLAEHRKALAVEMELPGYWMECVTNHPYSQKEALATGGVETGLLLGMTPAGSEMTGVDNFSGGRHALIPCYVPLPADLDGGAQAGRSRHVHVPARHAELVDRLYGSLGLRREVEVHPHAPDGADLGAPAGADPGAGTDSGGGTDPGGGGTVLTTDVTPAAGRAHLRVATLGDDLTERVAVELEGLMAFEVATTHIDVPLWQPAGAAAVEALEPLGFFWAALVPCFGAGGDVLRLQRLGDHAVQTEGIVCARAEAEQIRDFVLAEWHRVHRGRS